MEQCCKLEGHYDKPYSWVCTNPTCQSKRILCSKCLTLLHRNCLNFMLHIKEVFNKSFTQNSNWIQNKDIKDTILLVEKYGLTGSNEELIKAFEDLVNKEFSEVTSYFNEKIEETKDKIIKVFKESIASENIKADEFTKQVKTMYNFDTLANILDSMEKEQKEINTINKELTDYFANINSTKSQEQEVQKMAKNLNSFIKNYLEVDQNLFKEFKEAIPFDMFNKYSPTKKFWTWNPAQKSTKILLSDNNTKAKRNDPSYTYAAVIGSLKFAKGHYQWEIEVSSGNTQHQWITFGILEANLVKNLENFAYVDTNGLSTYGQYYKMNKVGTLPDFDNKTFLCDLNLIKGTFTISCEGTVICKEQNDLKDKTFLPFAILYRNENAVTVKVVKQ